MDNIKVNSRHATPATALHVLQAMLRRLDACAHVDLLHYNASSYGVPS
jgi:hypothetical protein